MCHTNFTSTSFFFGRPTLSHNLGALKSLNGWELVGNHRTGTMYNGMLRRSLGGEVIFSLPHFIALAWI